MCYIGKMMPGAKLEPDAIFIMSDKDFIDIINGDEDP